jgi:hypothetical protein
MLKMKRRSPLIELLENKSSPANKLSSQQPSTIFGAFHHTQRLFSGGFGAVSPREPIPFCAG